MARNKPPKPLVEAPPEPESSSEEEEASGSSSTEVEEEEQGKEQEVSSSAASSDEEDEETPSPTPPPSASAKKLTTTAATTTAKKLVTEEDSSDEDEPPVAKLKPTSSSKAIIDASPLKARSKPTIAALLAEKRPAETDDKGSLKKPRREKAGSGQPPAAAVQEEGSKKLFQRVFSAADEIDILNGMIEYRDKKGADPMNDVDDFYGFVKKLLHVDVNKIQLIDKIRRLKKKFHNAKSKKKKLTNEHERRSFELSKKIWDKAEDDSKEEKISNGVVENNNNQGTKPSSKPRILKIKSDNVVASEVQKNKVEEDGGKGGKVSVSDEMEEDLNVGEVVVKEKIRKRALKKMGAKGRAEINEMWEKVVKAEWEAKVLREEAEKEETRRIMEALGWGKR